MSFFSNNSKTFFLKEPFLRNDYESLWLEFLVYESLHSQNRYEWLPVAFKNGILCMPDLGNSIDLISSSAFRDDQAFNDFTASIASCLAEIHSAGFCLPSIRPEHIMLDIKEPKQAAIIDMKDALPIGSKYPEFLYLDPFFKARDASLGKPCSYLHDWESILFVIEYARSRSLPWIQMRINQEEAINLLKTKWINHQWRYLQCNNQVLQQIVLCVQQNNISGMEKMIVSRRSFDVSEVECEEIIEMSAKSSKGCLAENDLQKYAVYAFNRFGIKLWNERISTTFQDQAAIDAIEFVKREMKKNLAQTCQFVIQRYPQLQAPLSIHSNSLEINSFGDCQFDPILELNASTTHLPMLDLLHIHHLKLGSHGQVQYCEPSEEVVKSIALNKSKFLMEFYANDWNLDFVRVNSKLEPTSADQTEFQKLVESRLIIKALQLEKGLAFSFAQDLKVSPISSVMANVGLCGIVLVCRALDFSKFSVFHYFIKRLNLLSACLKAKKFFIIQIESTLSEFLALHLPDDKVQKHSLHLMNAYSRQSFDKIKNLENEVKELKQENRKLQKKISKLEENFSKIGLK